MSDVVGTSNASASSRFGPLIERRDGVDFPYYTGIPVALSLGQWLVVWTSVVAGFAVLLFLPAPNPVVALLPRILFVAIPLLTLAWAVGTSWTAIFRHVHRGDVLTMVGFAGLNLLVSGGIALIVRSFFGATTNPVVTTVSQQGALETFAFYLGTGIQIVGEEVFTLLPFLALLFVFSAKAKLSRKTSLLLAWLLTALWFGAAHLPTYGWNVAQAVLVIGGARVVLTLAFIRTKNLWISWGAHVLVDWTLFTFTLLVSR